MRIVALTATWCEPCRNLKPFIEDASYVVELDQYDVDSPEGQALVEEHSVTTVPTLLLIDHNGDEIERAVGANQKQLDSFVDRCI